MGEKQECPICGSLVELVLCEDVKRCPICNAREINLFLIRIIRTPAGPAPEWVREALVGEELMAEILEGPEVDFLSGQKIERRRVYKVPKDMILDILRAKLPEAASWFVSELPERMEHLCFAIDEAEVIDEGTTFVLDSDPEGFAIEPDVEDIREAITPD